MRARYGAKLRTLLCQKTTILSLIDFRGYKVFESATVDTNIIVFLKSPPKKDYALSFVNVDSELADVDIDSYVSAKNAKTDQSSLSLSGWTLADKSILDLKAKIEAQGKPLNSSCVDIFYGIKTGYNEAFIIDTPTKERLCHEDPRSSDVLKPILRGRDIYKYHYNWADLWLTFIPWHFPLHEDNLIQGASEKAEIAFMTGYPAVYNHLMKYREALSKRNKAETGINYEWYALQRCAATYYDEFESGKLVWAETDMELNVAYVPAGIYLNKTCFMICGENIKSLLPILNSKLISFYIRLISPNLGISGMSLSKDKVGLIPIPDNYSQDKTLVRLSDELHSLLMHMDSSRVNLSDSKLKTIISMLDQQIYKLYGLTNDEISIVESQNNG